MIIVEVERIAALKCESRAHWCVCESAPPKQKPIGILVRFIEIVVREEVETTGCIILSIGATHPGRQIEVTYELYSRVCTARSHKCCEA
jgi:hypothetical protein